MEKDAIQHYLTISEFSPMQAEALSRLLSDHLTKADLNLLSVELEGKITRSQSDLESKIVSLRSDLKESISAVRSDLNESISTVRSDLNESISTSRSDLKASISDLERNFEGMDSKMAKWVLIAIAAISAIVTLLQIFID